MLSTDSLKLQNNILLFQNTEMAVQTVDPAGIFSLSNFFTLDNLINTELLQKIGSNWTPKKDILCQIVFNFFDWHSDANTFDAIISQHITPISAIDSTILSMPITTTSVSKTFYNSFLWKKDSVLSIVNTTLNRIIFSTNGLSSNILIYTL